jgi:alanine racemase
MTDIRRPVTIHLKIDTGMHRQGILPEEIDRAIILLKNNPRITLQGICSHLSDADNEDASFTHKQILIWNNIVDDIKSKFLSLEYFHLSATDGHHYSPLVKANVSRLGLGLYGITENFIPELELQPVLQMKTIITGIKNLRTNETIGYGNTFKADHDVTVATIPVGYYEGINRGLSNVGAINVGPNRIECPIVGRVSMNISSIDISAVKEAAIGMEVVVIGNNPASRNSIQSIAKLCKMLSYEIAVYIPEHLKRVVVE